MKKLLISTVVLSGIAIVGLPNSTNAAEVAKTDTDIGVKFIGDEAPITDNGIGNLVLGKTPTSFNFADTAVSSGGFTDINLSNTAEQQKQRYIVVNDDRSKTNEDTTKRPTPWTVAVKYSPLTQVGGAGTVLKSQLDIEVGDLKEYYAGDKPELQSNGTQDYNFPTPSDPNATGSYAGDAVKTLKTGVVSLPGDDTVVPLLEKDSDELDAKHTRQNMGEQKGGQGYVLEFKNPVLKIQQATSGNEDQRFSSKLTYVLSNNL